MDIALFDYDLPPELIAQEPVDPRDQSRLMVVRRDQSTLEHRIFRDITDYLRPGDALVLNETRVIPARLFGWRTDTGGRLEVVLLKRVGSDRWEALVRPGKKAQAGTRLAFGRGELKAVVVGKTAAGGRVLQFHYDGVFESLLDQIGEMPLPPYITRPFRESDRERYQTVYAREKGSAAAPTAGLHFTPELLKTIEAMGVQLVYLVLHVGLGTFRPVKVTDIREHQMHSEYYEVSQAAAEKINQARANGGRIIAVGTTTTRTLETVADPTGTISPAAGWTDIFIYPGYRFKAIDGLITNFHLPRSTLLMLVSALAGREKILAAYETAVRMRYRFFSYGDAMLIL
ncbi:MAG: tRNA preQ1(34) S-adenosylmethionine ribosyltransferase-isomerase QueA [Firmicutes bacterium]|nr:tRNA preQ1(34) S-adenosylmethionine ribosyltransferase-isomerase QueA [Bacillota bacterium]